MKSIIRSVRCLLVAMCMTIFTACISQTDKKTKTDEVDLFTTVSNTNEKAMQIDYLPIPLPRLIGMADLVVAGTITSVQDSSFTFQISKLLTGILPSNSIEIKKYNPAAFFAPRDLPYMKLQRFIFFVQKPNQQDNLALWNILGFAGEGELPIDHAFVYLQGTNVEGLTKEVYDVHGVKRVLQRLRLPIFKDAVKNYSSCFLWELKTYIKNNKKRKRWEASKSCDDTILKDYRSKSWLHEYLVLKTLNKI